MKVIFHIDFNSYFATVEQQANPRLRGKPIGVTGGDRMIRTVLGAASVEAKKFGVRTGMRIPEALKLCPNLILVRGDSDKYLECTKRFLVILKKYSHIIEIFSIDEVFLEIPPSVILSASEESVNLESTDLSLIAGDDTMVRLAEKIKSDIRRKVGEWISCSIGISYNKYLAKLAGSLIKPDGLIMIANQEAAIKVLDKIELDEVCGIGSRIKRRLNNMGIFNFKDLRRVPLNTLLISFKSYGRILYDFARGIDERVVLPFYEKPEVKSVGHRLTLHADTSEPLEIKQVLLKLSELVARRLRAKKLTGRTISLWFRYAFDFNYYQLTGSKFYGDGRQLTITETNDGLTIFKAGWKAFIQLWNEGKIRMIGISVANLKGILPGNLSFLEDDIKQETITKAIDQINDRYGEFTLQRGVLQGTKRIRRMPNPFLSDRRFKI